MSMLMQLGTRAMFAAYAQLQTTGQNIANASTPGYSRQQVNLGTSEGQYTGSGFFGRGVTVQSVTRATNMFLTAQVAATKSEAAGDSARLGMLQQLEKVFGIGQSGLGFAATRMFNSFADLAAAPADMSARQAVLARAEDFASLARSSSDQIEMLQANAFNDVKNSISDVNTMAFEVGNLNAKIVAALATNHTPNDLMDARDRLITQISEKIEVQTINASDGSISVFVGGGQSLVLGGLSNKLVALKDDFDPSRVAVGISVSGFVTPMLDSALGAGAIAGLVKFQNDDLAEARNRLGQLVASLGTTMNLQQSYGIDLSGAQGSPLFKLGAPAAMPHAANARDPMGVPIGSVALAITDPSALQASEYILEPDPAAPGSYRVTRESDGQIFSPIAGTGDIVDGFSITFGAPPPQPGDRFLLKPVSTAAMNASTAITNARGIAAASPLQAAVPATNTGSMSIGSLDVVAAPGAAYQAMTVSFTSATGDYDILDSGGGVLASGTWNGSAPIAYNGFELSLKGVPALGDQVAINLTVLPGSSNGNALSFDGLASRLLINGQTVTDAYAETLSELGVRVQGTASAAETSAAVAQRSEEALTSEIGVNLDEEAARLIQYQQAYQAAAKMLQTAQQVMDTLISLGAR
ncbi:flagellar hook-associated protein FlgK [Aquincola sp. S2]|uniref:Flagellar hook-associated protein 1 n=1 Tax=Pseudaquabacterium terrae TaxID=2732868 RepID=A0ABX2ENV6_9BURK|nr:flagellar hook-associated protein FlgK [Aquabacterium terrae]NRF70336.1 flagellar hook-associated protein FlgK [Aquabacterium terrae]